MLVFNWLLGRDQVKHEIWPRRLAFFSVGELHAASKTSSANGSHLNAWGFDISAAEYPQPKRRAFLV